MTSQALTVQNTEALALTHGVEQALIAGNLAELTPQQRVTYYLNTCRSLGLNPMTRPFEYITLDDRLTLYTTRAATDQLRALHGVHVRITERREVDGVYYVQATAQTPDGRVDEATGAVPLVKEDGEWKTSQNGKRYLEKNGRLVPLPPAERANAIMRAETKAKRRVTLSICGLGWLDESEIDTIRGAHRYSVEQMDEREAQRLDQPPAPVATATVIEDDEPLPFDAPFSEPPVPAEPRSFAERVAEPPKESEPHPMIPAQKRKLSGWLDAGTFTLEYVDGYARTLFEPDGVTAWEQMTMAQAARLIGELEAELRGRKGQG